MTPPVCTTCGMCCVSLRDQRAFADVTTEDEERLGREFVRLHVVHTSTFDRLLGALDGREPPMGAIRTEWKEQKSGPLRGVQANACVALRGSLMRRVKCAVYERRPDACRNAIQPGDRTCRQLRNYAHEETLEKRTR